MLTTYGGRTGGSRRAARAPLSCLQLFPMTRRYGADILGSTRITFHKWDDSDPRLMVCSLWRVGCVTEDESSLPAGGSTRSKVSGALALSR